METTKANDAVKKELDDLLWSTRISIRYNNHRRKFYDLIHMWFTFIIIILGSFSVVSVLGNLGTGWIVSAGAIVAILSSIELVFGITKKARDHAEFSKSHFGIEREVLKVIYDPKEDDLIRLQGEKLAVDASEPPVLRVLWDYCYNEMLRLEGIEEGNKLKFKWYHPLTKYFYDFGVDKIASPPNVKPHSGRTASSQTV